jgi:hypothetical protein
LTGHGRITGVELRVCSIPECGLPVVARGWCRNHYQRWRVQGSPVPGGHVDESRPRCRVPGCTRFVNARGLCLVCWRKALAAGVRGRPTLSAPERFAARTQRTPEGCLLWTGGNVDPYGKLMVDGKMWSPRRWVWVRRFGEIPVNSVVGVKCGRSRFCEPTHLVLVLKRRAVPGDVPLVAA